ncbi:domain found in IF2B/IF5-domain-containing protein [Blyttiomyces helicus]|uniref:Domain found in IF2B/IF5-domain-containing protein n=1 Tax=Blyttiomyces helicus TaxID=388810 RepID=A0A4P9WHC7_9FUNG|nr:domain found in IF2B/IF5-domain-containing protein [Blyttiomyces helicus]|eukprot:RKO92134.1 domain found in IF2B/IF5-domain-containing protein [Blyttiomyces helicus]
MAGVVNIRRDVSDKFYRYKMPKIISKVEGKGNGIKTVVPNMSEVAKALSRPTTYPTKFFGCELGAQVKCDEKTDRYIVNGAHAADKLQSLLDVFIEKFVLCPNCKNPETDLLISKDETITRDCKACGANKAVDMRHKLCTFILKNPPATATNKKSSKKDKKSKKEKDGVPTPPDTASNESADEDDELTRRINAEAALLPSNCYDEDEDDWAQDTSADAVAARMKEMNVGGAVAKLEADGDDDEDERDDPLEIFATFISEHMKATDQEIIDASAGIRDDKVCVVLAQVLFDENVLTAKQIPSRAPLLRRFLKDAKCQKGLLGGIERLVAVSHKELLPKVAIILKALYDEDLVEEEVLLAWGEKASRKYVEKKVSKEIREKCAPFLTWLQEAEEEESDDEEESDEE